MSARLVCRGLSVCRWHLGAGSFLPLRAGIEASGPGRWGDRAVARPVVREIRDLFPAWQDQLLGPSELALCWAKLGVSSGPKPVAGVGNQNGQKCGV